MIDCTMPARAGGRILHRLDLNGLLEDKLVRRGITVEEPMGEFRDELRPVRLVREPKGPKGGE